MFSHYNSTNKTHNGNTGGYTHKYATGRILPVSFCQPRLPLGPNMLSTTKFPCILIVWPIEGLKLTFMLDLLNLNYCCPISQNLISKIDLD